MLMRCQPAAMHGHFSCIMSCLIILQMGFDPVFGVKHILGVGDVDAIGMAAKGRWRSRSIGHVGARQILTVVT